MDNDKKLQTLLRLFPYISNKKRAMRLKIDPESISYISLRDVAEKITNIIKYHLKKLNKDPTNIYITDTTAGVGGDTISFGMHFKVVHSIEIDELRYEYLVNNINVYNLTNIYTYNDDCRKIIPLIKKQHVVFMDPPWGGKDYKQHDKLTLKLGSSHIEEICNNLLNSQKTISPPYLIILKLPTNYDIKYLFKHIQSNIIYLHRLQKMYIVVIVNENITD